MRIFLLILVRLSVCHLLVAALSCFTTLWLTLILISDTWWVALHRNAARILSQYLLQADTSESADAV
jgi:hypothetical protein